jgi:hypothetical protein
MMKLFGFVLLGALFAGCATHTAPESAGYGNRRARLARREVPMPTTTPFDTDSTQRAVYREWYWFGYTEGLSGTTSSFCGSEHPWNDAQFSGHSDGNRDGITVFFKETGHR